MARAYYNEIDAYAAAWLRNLIAAGHIAPGDVDERSIVDVRPDDLKGYTQCHFFAGIGGWSYAARLAGWPDDRALWTGSCPCQPFSVAGRQKGQEDARHLWPELFRLVRARAPAVLMGEQVAAAVAWGWLDEVHLDLAGIGYAFGAAIVPAYGVGSPHRRDRLWFVADAPSHGREGLQRGSGAQVQTHRPPQALGPWNGASDPFADWEELLAGTEVRRLADGVSSGVGVRPALRAYGNAIVPQVAAEVIGAYLDTDLSAA